MNIVDQVLRRSEFVQRPPVLVDIGASGGVHTGWAKIARYSVCIAYDPDSREMAGVDNAGGCYAKLHVIPAAVGIGDNQAATLYLTASPYCSSLLEPDERALSDWVFADKFKVIQQSSIRTVTLGSTLSGLGIDRVDWFKVDSQGIDLRLFESLGQALCRQVIAAEFEPGIIDAYRGEDKLVTVLTRLQALGFWLARMNVRGTVRMAKREADALNPMTRRYLPELMTVSPCWAEMMFLNAMTPREPFDPRRWMLSWVVATIHGHHGFALMLAGDAVEHSADPIFRQLQRASRRQLLLAQWRIPFVMLRGLIRRARSKLGAIRLF